MPDASHLNKSSESKHPVPEQDSTPDGDTSSQDTSENQVNKKSGNYDDTAEVDKILEMVVSAQSEEGKELPPISPDQEDKPRAKSKTEITSGKTSEKAGSDKSAADSSTSAKESQKSPPPSPSNNGIDATKEEYGKLKEVLTQKNRLLSSGFVRLNLYLKHIRSQLDQLQSHIDKLSQESLKEIRSPLPDKRSWPKYSTPAEEDVQWKPLVDEIENLGKKPAAPPITLEMEEWPTHPSKNETEQAQDWDKTIVHLRRSAQKKKDQKEKKERSPIDSKSESKEKPEVVGEDQVIQSFGKVRESLRRIQGLMEPPPTGEEETPELEAPELEKETPWTEGKKETESKISHGEKLTFRQFAKDLKHSDKVIRIKAAEALAESRLKSTPEILIDAWCDETETEVRKTIIKALIELDYKEAVSFFTDALDVDDVNLQMAALEGLYKFETTKTTAGFLKALRSRFYHIRRRAVTYLGWNRVEVAFPQLIKMLKDENEFVRKATISTLFSFRNKEAIPYLIEVLHDSSLPIRKKAAEVLYRWTGLRNDFVPHASGSQRLEGIDQWKEWWKKNGEKFQISQIYRAEEPADGLASFSVSDKKKASKAVSTSIAQEKKAKTKEKSKERKKPSVAKKIFPVVPPPVKKKKAQKKIAKKKETSQPPVTAKPSRKRPALSFEQEPLVVAADIFPGSISEPISHKKKVNKKKTSPPPTREKDLQTAIAKAPDGITMKELGKKMGVKWQTLIPKINDLIKAKKIKKVQNKYFANKKSSKR
jgi:hypothetical protein